MDASPRYYYPPILQANLIPQDSAPQPPWTPRWLYAAATSSSIPRTPQFPVLTRLSSTSPAISQNASATTPLSAASAPFTPAASAAPPAGGPNDESSRLDRQSAQPPRLGSSFTPKRVTIKSESGKEVDLERFRLQKPPSRALPGAPVAQPPPAVPVRAESEEANRQRRAVEDPERLQREAEKRERKKQAKERKKQEKERKKQEMEEGTKWKQTKESKQREAEERDRQARGERQRIEVASREGGGKVHVHNDAPEVWIPVKPDPFLLGSDAGGRGEATVTVASGVTQVARDNEGQPSARQSSTSRSGLFRLQPPLEAARFIEDLWSIQYPEGITPPRPELNTTVERGKFRYDRDFLLQFFRPALCGPLVHAKDDCVQLLGTLGILPSQQNDGYLSRPGSSRTPFINTRPSLPPRVPSVGIEAQSVPGSGAGAGSSGWTPAGTAPMGPPLQAPPRTRRSRHNKESQVATQAAPSFLGPMEPPKSSEPEVLHTAVVVALSTINTTVQQLFSTRDLDAAEQSLMSLPARFHSRLIDTLAFAATRSNRAGDAELVCSFFRQVAAPGLCTSSAFEDGLTPTAMTIRAAAADNPKASDRFMMLLNASGLREDKDRTGRLLDRFLDSWGD